MRTPYRSGTNAAGEGDEGPGDPASPPDPRPRKPSRAIAFEARTPAAPGDGGERKGEDDESGEDHRTRTSTKATTSCRRKERGKASTREETGTDENEKKTHPAVPILSPQKHQTRSTKQEKEEEEEEMHKRRLDASGASLPVPSRHLRCLFLARKPAGSALLAARRRLAPLRSNEARGCLTRGTLPRCDRDLRRRRTCADTAIEIATRARSHRPRRATRVGRPTRARRHAPTQTKSRPRRCGAGARSCAPKECPSVAAWLRRSPQRTPKPRPWPPCGSTCPDGRHPKSPRAPRALRALDRRARTEILRQKNSPFDVRESIQAASRAGRKKRGAGRREVGERARARAVPCRARGGERWKGGGRLESKRPPGRETT